MATKLLKNTFIYALGDIIPKALSFVIFPILTTYLSPADYGIVNYVNTIVFFLTTIGFLCLNTYYLVYYYRIGGEAEQQKLLGSLSIFVVGLNIVLSLLLIGFGELFPNAISSRIDFFPYIALGVGINFFNILTILPSALYRVQERPLPLTALNVAKGLITMLLTLVLVVHYKFTALGVLWATFIVSASFGVVFLQITVRNMTWHVDWKLIRRALSFSLPLLPGSLAYYFLSASDRLFIEHYLNLTDLGVYSTASTLAMILNIIAYGSYKAFEPYFFSIYNSAEFKEQFVKIQNVFLLVILFGAMGLSLFAREFFILFASPAYQVVYYYVPMIEIGVVFSSMTMLYATIIMAKEKTKINSIVAIIGGGVSVLLNILLLPVMGISASCLASGVALGLIMVLLAYYAKLEISFIRPLVAFVTASLTVGMSVYVLNIESLWLACIVKFAIFAVSMGIIIRLLGLDTRKIIVSLQAH